MSKGEAVQQLAEAKEEYALVLAEVDAFFRSEMGQLAGCCGACLRHRVRVSHVVLGNGYVLAGPCALHRKCKMYFRVSSALHRVRRLSADHPYFIDDVLCAIDESEK
jgi:hypothetical protein